MSEEGEKIYIEAVRELRDSIPKIIINIGVAILIWAFTKYVFAPISQGFLLFNIPLPQLVSIIMIIAVTILVVGIVKELRDIIDALAAYASYEIGTRKGEVEKEELENYKRGFRGIFYVIIVTLLFLLYNDFLNLIHPVLAALTLLIIVIWSVYILISSGRAFSKIIEYYSKAWAEELEKRVAKEG